MPRTCADSVEDEFADIAAYVDALKRGSADVSLFAPDIEYEDANLPDHIGEHYRGADGLIRAGDRWLEGADWITVELAQVVGDRVVSIHRLRHKATHLDRVFEQPLALVWTFRDGKIVQFTSIRTFASESAATPAGSWTLGANKSDATPPRHPQTRLLTGLPGPLELLTF